MTETTYSSQHYQQQLEQKVAQRCQQFSEFNLSAPEVHPSPIKHYRMRAEFRVWHEGEDLYYIMFDQQTKQKYRVDSFPSASVLINQLMPLLIEQLKPNPSLRHKLFQVDFLSTLSGQMIISLLYHRQLDDEWEQQAHQLKQCLSIIAPVHLIGRAKKQKIVLNQDWVEECLNVAGEDIYYQQVENSFTQPNAIVNQKMLEWALAVTQDAKGDLLELYCGNGNFSLALARNFTKVLATEIAKPSVQAAQYNIAKNQVGNLKIIRLAAEEFTQAINGEREFRRLKDADVDLNDYDCNTIFVDPPRAGLDEASVKMVQGYQNIIYISCNPDTLYNNLQQLSQTHNIRQWALFDQFPYTHHIEVGMYLQKKA